MKIVISDYPDVLGLDLEKEYACLHEVLPEAEIVTHPYTDAEAFFREMQDADGLLTAFIPLDKQALDRMPRLKAMISALPTTADSGRPFAMPFAQDMMSGLTPCVCHANILPVRPKPVCTSSKINMIPYLSQMSRTYRTHSRGGTT